MNEGVGVDGGKETECERCGSLNFETSDGLLYCLECGTQSQDIREEFTEENVEASSFVRTLKAPSTKKKDNPRRSYREVTLLEKLQFILQVQCNALIDLGYDKSLKDAVKYLWFLYLKRYGYAFVEETDDATPAPSTPLVTVQSPANRSRTRKRRRRKSKDDPLPTPKRPKLASGKGKVCSGTKGKSPALFDNFPEDSCLFAVKQEEESSPEPDESLIQGVKLELSLLSAEELEPSLPNAEKLKLSLPNAEELEPSLPNAEEVESSAPNADNTLSGNDLYMVRRANRKWTIRFFSVKYTIGLLYLGLLYTRQKVLPSEMARLVSMNKVPYYNLHTHLPDHFIASRHSTSLYARCQMTSDKVHNLSQDLFKVLPLPKLPPLDPKWVCHRLLEKLQLPPAFHSMVDNVLDGGAYVPDTRRFLDLYNGIGPWREKRPDIECMGFVIFVMKMVYRLDDIYEFEQASEGVHHKKQSSSSSSSSNSGPTPAGYVYVWEDWVTLFCRHMERTLEKEIPQNARELDYVSDYQSFLDFCRVELFPNVRPKAGVIGRRRHYRHDCCARVSDVFKEHRTNLERRREECSEEEGSSDATTDTYSWDNFSPRLLPISALLEADDPPWKSYTATPAHWDDPREDFRRLSKSMLLLLELCSDVVDSTALTLMRALREVEWTIIQDHLDLDMTRLS